MRIQELNLIRYGKFTDRKLAFPASSQDIHLVVGPNEAGKSTVRSAISDWLFGIPMRTPLGFLHPMPELRVGGIMERQAVGELPAQLLAFERAKGNKNTLRTPQNGVLPDATLQPWLGALQVQAFNRMYALDHATLIEGGAGILSASDDIGRMLFQSAAGIEHLGEVLQKLQEEADALWAPRRSASRAYYQALDVYDGAHADFKNVALRTKDWKAQHEALQQTEQALALARERDADIRQQLSRLERIRRVRPMLLGLDAAQAQLDELLATGKVPLLPENAATVLSEARQTMVLAAADLQRLQNDVAEATQTLAGLQVDHTVLALSADITELNERRLQFRAHRTDMVKRAEEIRMEWLRLQELAAGLGWATDSEDAMRLRLPAQPVRARLAWLLKERAALAQQLRTATHNLAEKKQQNDQAQQSLAALTVAVVSPALASAVEQALKLGDHAQAVAALQVKLAGLVQSQASGLTALGTWRVEPAALQAMVVPEMALIQGLIDRHRADAAEAQALQTALDSKALEVNRLELALQHLVRAFQPVSREQVQAARHTRDADWLAIKLTPQALPQRAGDFEAHMEKADHLADARLDRAQYEADRQAKAEAVELQRLDLQASQQRLQSVQWRVEARAKEWQLLSAAAGLPQLPLEMAPAWIQQRTVVLALIAEHAAAKTQLQALTVAGETARQAIWGLLGAGTATATATTAPDLAECLLRARSQLALADQAQGQRKTLEQQLSDGQSSLVALQNSVLTAQAAWDTWVQAWQAAVQAAGYEASTPPEQVESELEGMQEIERLLGRVRSIRIERIDTMQADLDGLAHAATKLAERAAPDLVGQPVEDVVLALVNRLNQARQMDAASVKCQTGLSQSTLDLLTTQQKQLSVQASLAPLLTAAGVDDIDALGAAIECSDRRRALLQRMDLATHELAQAADGLAVDALRAEMAGIGPDALMQALEGLTRASSDVVQEISDHSNRYGTQKIAFDALEGADAGAKAEARRQEAIAAMGDAAERYLKLHTASRLLKWSMEKFRETKQGPMLAKASTLFNTLTGGSFGRLLVDTDEQMPRLFGIRPDGQQVDVTGMSEGTRDQLYLALRLAALALQVDQGLNMPLIADDLFINFDDHRTAAGLRVLGELSQKMQVVFLTHHDHLVPLAKDVLGAQLNVVLL